MWAARRLCGGVDAVGDVVARLLCCRLPPLLPPSPAAPLPCCLPACCRRLLLAARLPASRRCIAFGFVGSTTVHFRPRYHGCPFPLRLKSSLASHPTGPSLAPWPCTIRIRERTTPGRFVRTGPRFAGGGRRCQKPTWRGMACPLPPLPPLLPLGPAVLRPAMLRRAEGSCCGGKLLRRSAGVEIDRRWRWLSVPIANDPSGPEIPIPLFESAT
jgi:hypothetical protein